MQIPTLPLKVVALAPFGLAQIPRQGGQPFRLDLQDPDTVFSRLDVGLDIRLPRQVCPAGGIRLDVKQLNGFHPDRFIQNTPFLNHLIAARAFVQEAVAKRLSAGDTADRLGAWPDLPPLSVAEALPKPKRAADQGVENILKMIALPDEAGTGSAGLQALTTRLDGLLTQAVDTVLSDDGFQTLEAAWNGVKLLVRQGGGYETIQLDLVPVTRESLDETLEHLKPHLIRTLPSVLLIDLPFDGSPHSLDQLRSIAALAETLMVPALVWVTPRFFHLANWQELNRLPFLPHYLDEPAFAQWRALKDVEASRWLVVTCNRFLTRHPFGPDNQPRQVACQDPRPPWVSPVWALAALLGQSTARYGWPTSFTRWREIRLQNMALNSQDASRPSATEILLDTGRLDQFIRAGILPLTTAAKSDLVFTPLETTVAGSRLSDQLFVSRVTQFLIGCQALFPSGLQTGDLVPALRTALTRFWEKTGHPAPEKLEVSAQPPDDSGRIGLHIFIIPSHGVLPLNTPLEMDFSW
jgi:type VI secretion system protein ImpC